jgi:hypothetical protein
MLIGSLGTFILPQNFRIPRGIYETPIPFTYGKVPVEAGISLTIKFCLSIQINNFFNYFGPKFFISIVENLKQLTIMGDCWKARISLLAVAIFLSVLWFSLSLEWTYDYSFLHTSNPNTIQCGPNGR